jgi:hypothetical protein
LFVESDGGLGFIDHIDSVLKTQIAKEAPSQPGIASRFTTMFIHFMRYNLNERGLYINRLGALLAIGIFIGTLYLRLKPTTDNIGNYVGMFVV